MTSKLAYARFVEEAQKNRTFLFKDLETFPATLRESVVKNYEGRITRSHTKPMLGECAPWLLADILGIKSNHAVNRVRASWMNFYAFTLFMDDALDRSHKINTVPLLLASSLLLERGISNFYRDIPASETVRIRLDSYFIETASAVLEEIVRHKDRLSPFTNDEVDRIGQKVAFLKLCAAELLAVDGRQLTDDLTMPIERLATGMQLLDDVSDWEEDWRSGIYSHLLTDTFSRLKTLGSKKTSNPQLFNRYQVFAAIIVTGSLEDCLEKGLAYLHAIRDENTQTALDATCVLNIIINENISFLKEVRSARAMCLKLIDVRIRLFDQRLKKLLKNEQIIRKLQSIERKLTVVATNS